jgi:hypothetical protein
VTTYSGWVSTTWDFTGAVVTWSVLSGAPTGLDPTFSEFDVHGNELYNTSNQAFVLLDPSFVPAPRVTGIAPAVGPAAGGTNVTITGTGFTAATEVDFGTTADAGFTVNSDTSITAQSPLSASGSIDLTVISAGGTSATSAADAFTFVGAPTITGLSPDVGPVTGGNTVTITGTNLSGATTVVFGENPVGFAVIDDTSIAAFVPAGEAPDTVSVTVTTIGGTSPNSPAARYTYAPVPTAPAVVTATPGNGTATLKWAPAGTNGGSAITGYVITPYVDWVAQTPTTFASTATTGLITGLTNGTIYTFTVAATNTIGIGTASTSNPVTVGTPSRPTAVKARATPTSTTTGSLTVSFVPGSLNGAPIESFIATCVSTNGGVGNSNSQATSPITVSSLTTGKNYTCTVDATNAWGTGTESAKSPAVIVGAPAQPAKPTITRIASGSLKVAFVPPANNGAPITSFTAKCTSTNGGQSRSTSGPAGPLFVTGLSPAKTYTCTIRATNNRGPGPLSPASNATAA